MLHRGLRAWRDRAWLPPMAALLGMTLVSSALLGGLGYEVADRLIHPPREVPDVTPLDRGIAFEPVSIMTEDGVRLAAWWLPYTASEPVGTVLFLHGYGASKAQSLAVAPFLHRAGYHVLAFDFRAHGESGGAHTTVGLEEVKDVLAAHAWLASRAEVDDTRIVLFGWSMGGATALNAAGLLPGVRGFVVDSAFARLENVLSHTLPAFTGLPHQPFGTLGILFASWMVQRGVWENEPARSIAQLDRPILIIQGLSDTIADPHADAEALHEASPSFSELWLVPDASHVDARRVDPAAYEAKVLDFLDRALDGSTRGAPPRGPTA